MQFFDREEELAILETAWRSERSDPERYRLVTPADLYA